MNIAVQVCGLINTIVLLIFYNSSKRLMLYKRRIFYYILLITLFNITTDILSVFSIHFSDNLSPLVVEISCKLYLCMLVVLSWSALIYTISDIMPKQKHIMVSSLLAIVGIIECFMVVKYPIYVYNDGYYVFTYGMSVKLLYIFGAVNVCAIWISTFVFSDRILSRRKYAVRLWMGIWLAGMAIQAINNSLLVAGFAASLGMMVVYFLLENPEGNIDKQFDCLNSIALSEYTGECILNEDPFILCNISFDDSAAVKGGDDNAEKKLKDLIDYLNTFKGINVFKSIDKNIIITSTARDKILNVINGFRTRYRLTDACIADSKVIMIEDAHSFTSIEEILRLINYMKSRRSDDAESLVTVTDKNVEDYERHDMMKDEIRRALREDRVEVFFQPIYNTVRKCFTSAEALVRIRNKDGSLIPPGMFIPVAEVTGQINELGRRVLEKTCEFMAGSEAADLGLEYIEVNLSVVQAERVTLFEEIMDTVKKYRVEPKRINLEITESALIQAKDAVLDNMNRLKDVGFTFALDDFGKGESNLMYLVEMPFDILKLDMDMTKAFHVNDKAKSAVKTVRYMADDMKLKVVAEGIENQNELDAFVEYDIDYIQGYHFSKPLPKPEFIDFVRKNNEGCRTA
ncbi:MAG: EAL domain-containing protein [Lachnospiraceae bacterium]|nr:EAL domain-containing protein [Lachnospiraceae bacterium]